LPAAYYRGQLKAINRSPKMIAFDLEGTIMKANDDFTKIDTAAQSLLSIMNELPDFSKMEADKLSLEHITLSLDEAFNHLHDKPEEAQRLVPSLRSLAASLGAKDPEPTKSQPMVAAAPPKLLPSLLVVDDEPFLRKWLASTFHDDYEVLLAKKGITALKLAALNSPDTILLDVMMPGMDGYEVFRRLQGEQQTRNIPVIFLTGAVALGAQTDGAHLEATDFVNKPINAATLRARIRNEVSLKQSQEQILHASAQKHLDDLAAEVERSSVKERARSLELEMKDQFLSHISHELRTPLTSIYLFVSLIADRLAGETTQEQKEYLNRTLANVEQMRSMIDNLLDTTRMWTGKLDLSMESVSVPSVVDYAMHTLEQAATTKSIALSSHIREGLSPVYADPDRLRQILVILLENAVKFTPRLGSVGIEARLLERDPNFLLMEVFDTGCGIRPEVRDIIFERLYQVDSSDQGGRMGLGLGLHLAKELVNKQGGEIWVESVPEKGSHFRFTLPVYRGQPVTPSLLI
jgi:signal transduction histidine kinase